ncbi:MAG TPA: PLP-dependent aspartate aminotransferase family protein [Candidatus Marinimicrobia bacterium]|nr:PLP-dependent aspartate aminotransferase family protein [Candidatus Neomarinimicrobiota bacterium]
MPKKKNKLHFSTKSIHVGNKIDETGAAVTPIHFTSTFKQPTFASTEKYVYSRVGSPTLEALEENLAMLENAKYAYAFSSGMAAMTAIFTMFKPGDHVLISQNVYGGVFRLVTRVLNDNKVDFEFIDTSNVDKVTDSIKDNTKLIHLETPSNPLLDLADIERISKVAHEKNVLVSVDNTFMSPYGQRPLDLGADIVMHSTTKFISGHSDVLSGALMINNDEASKKITLIQNTGGALPSPFDAWLLLRSVKTLSVRVEKQFDNAYKIAHWLDDHSKITRVIYPGLKSHKQFDLATKQHSSPDGNPVYGSMISFELDQSINLDNFAKQLSTITLAESLGGVKSLISCPYSMTHASVPHDEKTKLGITPNLLRFSVGIEHVDDLISELDFAINHN